jgi:hypothetical protein
MSRISPTVVSIAPSGVPAHRPLRYRLLCAKAQKAPSQPQRADLAKARSQAAVLQSARVPAHANAAAAIGSVRPVPTLALTAAEPCPPHADMPEIDLRTDNGQLRRDIVVKVLERIEFRLAHMAEGTTQSPMIHRAAARQRGALQAVRWDLASSPADPGAGTVPGADPAGLDADDSEKLLRVLRQTRKAIYAPPSIWARLWQRLWQGLRQGPDRRNVAPQPDAVLEMLLRHMEVQTLAGWAALARLHVQSVQADSYRGYDCPGNGESSFLGTVADIPLGSAFAGIAPGVIAGATILGRDLGACEDGSVEQSSWWSMTLGASLTAGIAFIKARLGLSVSLKRTRGVFFEDVGQLVASPEGQPYRQRVADPMTRRLKRAMGRGGAAAATGLTLEDLADLQERAYAERDIFAKVLGPLPLDDGEARDTLHMVRITRAAPAMPRPTSFKATEVKASAELGGTAGVPGLVTGTVKVAGEAVFKQLAGYSRKGFWQAVRHLDLADGASLAPAERERVAALRALSGRVEPGLRHLRAGPAAGTPPGPVIDGWTIEHASAPELVELLLRMEREFDRYCYSRTQVAAGMPRHEEQARAIESAWGVHGSNARYAYIQAQAIAHALIGLRLKTLGHGDNAVLERLAGKLESPDMVRHDACKTACYTTFSDQTDLLEYSFPLSLQVGVSMQRHVGGAGAVGSVGMSAGVVAGVQALATWRCDANTLRAGRYLRLSFDVSVLRRMEQPVPAIGQFLNDHAAQLGLDVQAIGPGIEGLGELLRDYLVAPLDVSVKGRATLCYYQPRDSTAAGRLRLQYARLTSGSAAPGVESSRLWGEKLGTDTLSYLFMRHHAYFSRAGGAGVPYWNRFCAQHRASIAIMLAKLADPAHPIRAEAQCRWDQVVDVLDPARGAEAATTRAAFFDAVQAYARAPSEIGYRVAKAALDGLAAAHLAPWEQSLREHVHGKARIEVAR